jgi:cytochrome c biogenesis protein CcmG, thiol:disulfide interchange protein DsbE
MTTTASTDRKTIIWIVVGVVVVVGLFVLALLSAGSGGGGGLGGSYQVEAFGDVEVTGERLSPLNPQSAGLAVNDPSVGLPAPVSTGTDWDGNPSVVPAPGEPTVIVFLAHWCPHCQSEVPRLVRQMNGGDTIAGAKIVGVATSSNITRGNFPPAAWLSNEGWTGGVLMDDQLGSTLVAYGLGSFPAWAVVAADGTIVARATGELNPAQVEALAALATQG